MNRKRLEDAVREGIITTEQADKLVAFLGESAPSPAPVEVANAGPRFGFVNVLYYFGGMIAVGAMSLFMTLGWNALGGFGGFITALLYLALFLGLTHWLSQRGHTVPAGITATLAVVMVPLAIFSLQMALGYWDSSKPYRDYHVFIDWRWIMMEFATLGAGAYMLWRYRFPFMMMPIAVTVWYMSMDLVPYFTGDMYDYKFRRLVSLVFGMVTILVAFWVDLRSRFSRDYAFWLYLFGVIMFWGSLSLMDSGSEWGKVIYAAINVAMILVGGILGRRVFAVFGGFGVAGYLGYISWKHFKDSLLFPFALVAIGLGIIAFGIVWQKNEARWASKLRSFLPRELRELIEQRAKG
jgi:hypothetical protein